MNTRMSACFPSQRLDASKIIESVSAVKFQLPKFEKLFHSQHPHNPFKNFDERKTSPLEELHLPKEKISPSDMESIWKLLSIKQEQSPRNELGDTWREYHGSHDWMGLLEPLDQNLRRELVRYGEFAQSAYTAFNSNPKISAEEEELFPIHVSLNDTSYTVTKSLYATSSVGLPKWVDDMAPDWSWMTQRSSWIGYVAVCDDEREIQRMGRRDIVIALRGTSTCLEWAENMRAQLVPLDDGDAKVEYGFLSLFRTRHGDSQSLSDAVLMEIERLIEYYEGKTLSITITGHSLGAALALLVADRLATCGPSIAVISFGGPRVGNRAFASRLNKKQVKVLRVVNSQDVITKVPGLPMVNVIPDGMPLSYSHVGTELRVQTKMSPYLKADADVACCHDLEAYLHLVDGYLSSEGPFRADAKRCVMRLFREHTSNVKRLSINNALKY